MEWISVKDRLPEIESGILAAVKYKIDNKTRVSPMYYDDEGWNYIVEWPEFNPEKQQVTHWMEYPLPPKQ